MERRKDLERLIGLAVATLILASGRTILKMEKVIRFIA
jgi:hypothetical protein